MILICISLVISDVEHFILYFGNSCIVIIVIVCSDYSYLLI